MSEIVPSFDEYHQRQIIRTFRNIGKYLVDSLIVAGECLSLKAPNSVDATSNAITDVEIQNFARQSQTTEFDRHLEAWIREHPVD